MTIKETDRFLKQEMRIYKVKWYRRIFKVYKRWYVGLTYPFIHHMKMYPIVFGKRYAGPARIKYKKGDSNEKI